MLVLVEAALGVMLGALVTVVVLLDVVPDVIFDLVEALATFVTAAETGVEFTFPLSNAAAADTIGVVPMLDGRLTLGVEDTDGTDEGLGAAVVGATLAVF